MWHYNYTDELYHYGVPGMKWGHRKAAQYYTKMYNKQRAAAKELSAFSKQTRNPVQKAYQKDAAQASRESAQRYKAKAQKHALAGKPITSRQTAELKKAKADYKTARKEYNKAFDKAYANSTLHPITQFVTAKGKAKSDMLWNEAYDKGQAGDQAKKRYKDLKRKYR